MWAFGVGLFVTGDCYRAETGVCVIICGFPDSQQYLFPVPVKRFFITFFLKFIGGK